MSHVSHLNFRRRYEYSPSLRDPISRSLLRSWVGPDSSKDPQRMDFIVMWARGSFRWKDALEESHQGRGPRNSFVEPSRFGVRQSYVKSLFAFLLFSQSFNFCLSFYNYPFSRGLGRRGLLWGERRRERGRGVWGMGHVLPPCFSESLIR